MAMQTVITITKNKITVQPSFPADAAPNTYSKASCGVLTAF